MAGTEDLSMWLKFATLPAVCGWFVPQTNSTTPAPFWPPTEETGERLWKRFSGGKEGTLWNYREMAKAFKRRDAGRVVAEVEELVGRRS
jgi:hypothetical protein